MLKIDFLLYLILTTIGYIVGLYISYKKIFINHGPDSNSIRTIQYKYNGKCYKFIPKKISC